MWWLENVVGGGGGGGWLVWVVVVVVVVNVRNLRQFVGCRTYSFETGFTMAFSSSSDFFFLEPDVINVW